MHCLCLSLHARTTCPPKSHRHIAHQLPTVVVPHTHTRAHTQAFLAKKKAEEAALKELKAKAAGKGGFAKSKAGK